MGESPFMLSATISVIYLLLRFLEMRFVLKEMKPLKTLIRDALLVYLSTLSGFYMLQHIYFAEFPKKNFDNPCICWEF